MTTGSVIGAALLAGVIGGISIPINTPKGDRIRVVFNEEPNGDYRALLYGENRSLVCEEQDIRIIQQGDAVKPMVIECRHEPYIREQ